MLESIPQAGEGAAGRRRGVASFHRAIPNGCALGVPEGGGPNEDRGLLFLCYQKDIEAQFEFVQTQWVNEAGFPCPEAGSDAAGKPTQNCPGDGLPDGEDPVIAQTTQGPYNIPAKPLRTNVTHFVTTTGGDYFFSPSIEALVEVLSAS